MARQGGAAGLHSAGRTVAGVQLAVHVAEDAQRHAPAAGLELRNGRSQVGVTVVPTLRLEIDP